MACRRRRADRVGHGRADHLPGRREEPGGEGLQEDHTLLHPIRDHQYVCTLSRAWHTLLVPFQCSMTLHRNHVVLRQCIRVCTVTLACVLKNLGTWSAFTQFLLDSASVHCCSGHGIFQNVSEGVCRGVAGSANSLPRHRYMGLLAGACAVPRSLWQCCWL